MAENMEAALERLRNHAPRLMESFFQLHDALMEDGVLDAKTKRLIQVGIATALRCEPCIRRSVSGAVELGVTRDEILEAAGVAVLMGGAPSMAYCAHHVMDVLEELEKESPRK
ncbi:alkylhydroperoxidase AhpD family core domain-containing protein [Desulfacinum hydrothermale DSM 13146]|uniref:Alkylhydroperoxidase AhpD family core domain-containing protein n=1 Tax=Desulfacinum hydrothermale DSM 13146 TaxID=1121390 RepID=A0A1W1XVX0_9BACT|nr:carboxymuconolactone decarboxylase family protein [Desulfacinum hydrothermale]SMC28027.1 alkylhydroperoxidase AhpD family core domain-containing protein [Desulfacinum hydrothermale DSM 13146]